MSRIRVDTSPRNALIPRGLCPSAATQGRVWASAVPVHWGRGGNVALATGGSTAGRLCRAVACVSFRAAGSALKRSWRVGRRRCRASGATPPCRVRGTQPENGDQRCVRGPDPTRHAIGRCAKGVCQSLALCTRPHSEVRRYGLARGKGHPALASPWGMVGATRVSQGGKT